MQRVRKETVINITPSISATRTSVSEIPLILQIPADLAGTERKMMAFLRHQMISTLQGVRFQLLMIDRSYSGSSWCPTLFNELTIYSMEGIDICCSTLSECIKRTVRQCGFVRFEKCQMAQYRCTPLLQLIALRSITSRTCYPVES